MLLVDFMSPRGPQPNLIRLVIGERGVVDMHTELIVRFSYGAVVPWVTHVGERTWQAIAGPDRLVLHTPVAMRGEDLHSVAELAVSKGQVIPFALTYSSSHLPFPATICEHTALAQTERFWHEWVGKCTDAGRHRDAVVRSLITLRALIHAPTGGGVAGERRLIEQELSWLPGYEGSRPVRIGNAAHAQLQLDVFGEVMDALHQARQAGLRTTESGWAMQRALLDHLEKVWTQPDYGIWEVRGPPRHFTYSKVMAWVAFDRAIKSAERFGLRAVSTRGARFARRFISRFAIVVSIPRATLSCSPMAVPRWMRGSTSRTRTSD